MKLQWNEITAEDVYEAIRIYDQSSDNPPPARNTFLEVNGKSYPAKHIRAIAYQVAYGTIAPKSEFAGGAETVRFFERLGFTVEYTPRLQQTLVPLRMQTNIESSTEVVSQNAVTKTKPEVYSIAKITSKEVVEQKNALQLVLNKRFCGDIVSEKTFDWLVTPYDSNTYTYLVDALHEFRGRTDFQKPGYKLRCDFVCESQKLIFEYDERQHFTLARKAALESYPQNLPLYFDKQRWCTACETINARDNNPLSRDETRAYYDSIRDIQSAKNGYRLIRIMHGSYNWESKQALQYIDELLNYNACVENTKGSSFTESNQKVDKGCDENSVIVVTATLQSESKNRHDNKARMKTLKKVLLEYANSDIILFPAGFFYYKKFSECLIMEAVNEVSEFLRAQSSNAVVCLGIDCDSSKDQLAVAIQHTGLLSIGRKFYPTEDEKFTVNVTDTFDSEEMGYKRIFEKCGKKLYLAVCYDVFGIRHQKIINPGVDVILTLVHRFCPRGDGPSGEVDFARKGFAGASVQWNCPVFGTAVFFDRQIPDHWPTGVLWQGDGKSVKNFKYTDNRLHSDNNRAFQGCDEYVMCYQYHI